jgi:hypothetical protein
MIHEQRNERDTRQPFAMRTTRPRFGELDDLVLRLKGLVLVRDLRKRGHADQEELEMYRAEIQRVRARLADLVRNGGGVECPAA